MTPVLRRILNLSKDDLYRSSVILFVGAVAGGGANYLFQIIMGRMLPVTTFGELNTLLALITIIGIPFAAITNYIAREVAGLMARGENAATNSFVLVSYRWILSLGLLACLLMAGLSGYLADFFKMEQRLALALLALAIYLSLGISVTRGVLQGTQNFWMLSFMPAGLGFSKLLFCVALVYLGYALAGVMAGIALGSMLVLGIASVPVMRAFRSGFGSFEVEAGAGYRFLPILLANFAFAVLSQSDIILVKRLFTAYDAGIFSSAAIIAKIVLYLPTALSLALFPMVASYTRRGGSTRHYLSRSLTLTLLIAMSSAALLYLYPQFLIATFFGEKFLTAVHLLGPFALAVAPMTLVHLIMTYEVARGRAAASYVMMGAAAVQVLGVYFVTETLHQVLSVILVVNLVCVVVLLMIALSASEPQPEQMKSQAHETLP